MSDLISKIILFGFELRLQPGHKSGHMSISISYYPPNEPLEKSIHYQERIVFIGAGREQKIQDTLNRCLYRMQEHLKRGAK
jgi:hypothetical protein